MKWIEISIYTTHEGIEPVSGRLEMLDIPGVMVEDSQEFQEFLEQNVRAWDVVDDDFREKYEGTETVVKAYISDIPENEALLRAVEETVEELRAMDKEGVYGRLFLEKKSLEEEDWQEGWKQYYKPLRIGSRVLIKPSWEEVIPEEGEVIVELDPGMAFGTGTHETTHMCVLLLEKYLGEDKTVLDIGTGSGILAITCARLGAKEVLGTDIDPLAVKIARENADMNGLSQKISVAEGDLVDAVSGTYDIVVANIIADIIKILAPKVPPFMKEDGIFIASGIIKDKYEMVKEAVLSAGLTIIEEKEMNEWCALVATK